MKRGKHMSNTRLLDEAAAKAGQHTPEILGNATGIVQPESDSEVVVYRVWVEVERLVYDTETGDESGYVDCGMDFLDGAHVAEFMAGSPSPLADELAQHYVTAFGKQLQRVAQELAPDLEGLNHRVQAMLVEADRDADGNGGA